MADPYLQAGYVAQCGCNLDSALEYVTWEEGYPAFERDQRIWLLVDNRMEIPTPYYWENGMLYKKIDN